MNYRVSALNDKKKLHEHRTWQALYHLVQPGGYKDIVNQIKKQKNKLNIEVKVDFKSIK